MAKKVLIIDDNQTDAALIEKAFKKELWDCCTLNSGIDTVSEVYEIAPDIIVLDVLLEDVSGYEIVRELKSEPKTSLIPVILYTALDKNIDKFWAYRAGADLFLNKKEGAEKLCLEAEKLSEAMPVPIEYKYSLLASSPQDLHSDSDNTTKEGLIKAFSDFKIKSKKNGENLLNLFKFLSKNVEFDALMLCFYGKSGEKTQFFDLKDLAFSEKTFDEALLLLGEVDRENVQRKIVSQNKNGEKIESLTSFKYRLEFETQIEEKPTGFVCFWIKENLPSNKLKLVKTLKLEMNKIMNDYFLEGKNIKVENGKRGRIYSKVDLMRMLDYERTWHNKNNANLALCLFEIADFEKMAQTLDSQVVDTLLAKVSNALMGCLEGGDFSYRDEDNIFIVVMTNIEDEKLRTKLQYIKEKLQDPFWVALAGNWGIKVNICAVKNSPDFKNTADYLDYSYQVLFAVKKDSGAIIIK